MIEQPQPCPRAILKFAVLLAEFQAHKWHSDTVKYIVSQSTTNRSFYIWLSLAYFSSLLNHCVAGIYKHMHPAAVSLGLLAAPSAKASAQLCKQNCQSSTTSWLSCKSSPSGKLQNQTTCLQVTFRLAMLLRLLSGLAC